MFMAAATRGTKAAFKDIIDSSNVVESMTTKVCITIMCILVVLCIFIA